MIVSDEFKATKENLLALVESANNINSYSGKFIQTVEPMPLNEHPLRDEVLAKTYSGDIIFS